jgi:hypothetical protein
VLPAILGILASGAASAGMLGGLSPLLAGAIGSGLGSWAQTGELERGLMSGLGAYAGGAAFGGGKGGGATQISGPQMPGGAAAGPQPNPNYAAPTPGIFGSGGDGIMGMLKGGYQTLGPAGLLGAALPELIYGPQDGTTFEDDDKPKRVSREPYHRGVTPPPPGYRPGIDPEHRYFQPLYRPTGFAETIKMSEGGIVDMPSPMAPKADPKAVVEQMSDKEVVSAATMAIKGMLTDKEAAIALGAFLQRNGQDALQKLVDDVLEGKAETYGGKQEGKLEGPGDGEDDLIPAKMAETGQDVLLSNGEYIVPSDVVEGIGGGSSDAGAAKLDDLKTKVRSRTGAQEMVPA